MPKAVKIQAKVREFLQYRQTPCPWLLPVLSSLSTHPSFTCCVFLESVPLCTVGAQ